MAADPQYPNAARLGEVMQKYTDEANRRLAQHPEGGAQYAKLAEATTDQLRRMAADPWVDHAALNAQTPALQDGDTIRFLLLGAGLGGILSAVHLLEAGFSAEELRFVDQAGGFGGTWYWNRFPGLQCDVESYCYLPLLEVTGFVPSKKYVSGSEIRTYLEQIVAERGLQDKALFRTEAKTMDWDEAANVWRVALVESRGGAEVERSLTVSAQYVLLAPGVLSLPRVPRISGLDTFAGPVFHTARWDYGVTGGLPDVETDLPGLAGKRVGVVGTGGTAVQVIPQLARAAGELFVFQRTPSAVHPRRNVDTDPDEFRKKVATHPGWQVERADNFSAWLSLSYADKDEAPAVNLVNDVWSHFASYSGIIGSPFWGIIEPTPAAISQHVVRLNAVDLPITEAARARVDTIVRDPATAATLKAWYPTWCKRPTFSDTYLDVFNQSSVKLVDVSGAGGVSEARPEGLVAADGAAPGAEPKLYPLDVIILCTGYASPSLGGTSPAFRSRVTIRGRDGRDFDEKWTTKGAGTLHGITSVGFPNLFFFGLSQAGQPANVTDGLNELTRHVAYIIAEAEKRVDHRESTVVEAEEAAQEAWAGEILKRAAFSAGMIGCTPGYITADGLPKEAVMGLPAEEQVRMARKSLYGDGWLAFKDVLEAWRAEGGLPGVNVVAAQ